MGYLDKMDREQIKKELRTDLEKGLAAIKKGVTVIQKKAEELTEEGKRQYKRLSTKAKIHDAMRDLGTEVYMLMSGARIKNPALNAALKTWKVKKGEHPWWELGGGGAPWNSMAYDPKLKLLYVGTGNGDPWNREVRSPGGGDNLYLSSILALHVETGKLAWYYQVVPGDTLDFDATADLELADLKIDGKLRHVIMQAPKDGFFYVLDRETGKLISAKPFAVVNWAKSIDLKTGRPIENPAARYKDKMAVVMPRQAGGHNWQPMSFDPETGLVYIPSADGSAVFVGENHKNFVYRPRAWNIGVDFAGVAKKILELVKEGKPPPPAMGYLKAWNPVTQKEVWHQPMGGAWNGGVLSTGGNLVFTGGAGGVFAALNAQNGEQLGAVGLENGILAPPMSLSVNGGRYLSPIPISAPTRLRRHAHSTLCLLKKNT